MSPLTHDDARGRAATIRVDGYDVALDLTVQPDGFRSVSTVRLTGLGDGGTSWLDVAGRVTRAVLDGVELDPASVADGRLPFTVSPGGHELVVDADMAWSNDGEGLHRHVDPADGETYLYAMSFLDAAPRWFACADQPDLKAPLALDVTCPDAWVVRGNAKATPVGPGRWRLATEHPIATYTATLVAGPYATVAGEHDGIPLGVLARRSLADVLEREAPEVLEVTASVFDRLHGLFGVRYPWGELHHAFVPDFNAGAMENPGCVTYRDQMLFRSRATGAERRARAVTIAHEMAHQWFGDLVTMRWWDDLWLNESFAEYLGHRATGGGSWAAFGAERKSWGHRADRRPSTHPVAGNGAPDTAAALADFDGISYAKGAAVLRQLATHLGDDVFLRGLRAYVGEHAHGNAEFADLLAAWTAAGAVDLEAWARRWLTTTGLDTLAVDGEDVLRDGTRPHAVEVASLAPDGSVTARARVDIDSARTPHGLTGDLLVPDAGDDTWAKLALPVSDWQRLVELLPRVPDERLRVALWNALQLAVADAEVDPLLALDVVVAGLPTESDTVLAVVGRWALRTVGTCLPAVARDAVLDRLTDALTRTVQADGVDDGRRLAAFRVTAGATRDADVLRGWLDGDVPAGVVLDADLAWLLRRRLAVMGALDDDELAAALAADHSAQGRIHAAACRSARPDAAAKQSAWTVMTTDPGTGPHELAALAEGFWQPGQDLLLTPYVERWAQDVRTLHRVRSGWVLERLALQLHPWTLVTEDTLATTERVLADPDLPAGVRRSTVDAADDLRRALAVRVRFG